MPYFDEPVVRVKIRTASKNSQRYYTTKRLVRYLSSNLPNVLYVRVGEFRRHLFTGNAWQNYAKRNGIGAGNPANWLVNSKQTCLTSPVWSTNTAWYLYSFWALFVQFLEVQLDNKYVLLDVLLCSIAEYFGKPVGRVKIQTTSKNSQQYYTTKCRRPCSNSSLYSMIVECALPFDHQLSCTIIDYHQLSFIFELVQIFHDSRW